jgi:hypothetical protein
MLLDVCRDLPLVHIQYSAAVERQSGVRDEDRVAGDVRTPEVEEPGNLVERGDEKHVGVGVLHLQQREEEEECVEEGRVEDSGERVGGEGKDGRL